MERAVEAIHPGTVRDCREFYKKYDGIENFEIYGNDRYIYQYISEKYPEDEIKFDISKIKLVTLDIETTSEQGFPDVESCVEEILAITIQDYTTKQIVTWGSKPFKNTRNDVIYHHCPTEYELLTSFHKLLDARCSRCDYRMEHTISLIYLIFVRVLR